MTRIETIVVDLKWLQPERLEMAASDPGRIKRISDEARRAALDSHFWLPIAGRS